MSTTYYQRSNPCPSCGHSEDEVEVAHSHYGGAGVGTVVTWFESYENLPDDTVIYDEYGDKLTAGILRSRVARGKGATSIGEIGELFGYKDTGK